MSTLEGLVILFARVVGSAVFAYSAYNNLRNPAEFVHLAQSARMPLSRLAGLPSGLWLAASTTSVVFGIWPDLGAVMLAVFTVPAALYFHAFWTTADPVRRRADRLAFLRNVNWFAVYLGLAAIFAGFGHALRFTITGPLF